jgi:VanZ family protein
MGSSPAARLSLARRAALAAGVLLFTLTSWPSPPQVAVLSSIPDFDKFVHVTLYALVTFWLYLSVRWPGRPGFSIARVLAVVGAMAVWAIADETHQYWIPGRSMEGWDVAADVTGAVAGAILASAASGLWRDRSVPP